ncbi:MAG: 3'(2'),5'-bisphosphate nucleotidase [Fuerstiella sp.]|jgi:3'(2'), 5'-bisphosphate nucleotidase|nr:3'(2'),5'-bisphosphate nucleotidase [Fuerstiella sp.]
MTSLYASELKTGLQAVRQAADVCRTVQAAISAESLEKKDKSPVTVADFASQAMICRQLQAAFPDDPVIGEEGAEELREPAGAEFLARIVAECGSVGVDGTPDEICDWIDRGGLQEYRSRFWTLDPIDGTKGFLRKEQYAISLALIVDGEIQIGILGCPNMPLDSSQPDGAQGILSWAVKGTGSFIQPLDSPGSEPRRVQVSSTAVSSDARFCESVESGHSSHDWSGQIGGQLGIRREPFRIDSQCKYLAVAMGDADIYLRLPTRKDYQEKIWDHAGGILVVEEAGGMVTDIHGKAPEFHHGATLAMNKGMVVTNGQFHDAVVAAVTDNSPDRIPPELS